MTDLSPPPVVRSLPSGIRIQDQIPDSRQLVHFQWDEVEDLIWSLTVALEEHRLAGSFQKPPL